MTHDIKSNRLSNAAIACHFQDIAPLLSDKQVLVESERCLFCYDAPCIDACPTGINIPLFIRQINSGNNQGAAKEILSANILGGSCARVCPTEVLCEQACVRNTKEQAAVSIGRLQRYAVDNMDAAAPYPFSRAADSAKQVAIVGAGPAGLACAHRLSRFGHKVVIYEAEAKAAGLNEYGIAHYKMLEDYAQKEVDFVLQLGGIEIKYATKLGRDLTLNQLRSDYDAVFIGIGMSAVNALNIPGAELPGVIDAVDYIRDLRQTSSLASLPVGRRVVVIGAGMTAIDIAVQSKKLGAEEVSIVYRRDQNAMGASEHEQNLARANGVRFVYNAQPKQIIGDAEGVSAIEFNQTQVGDDNKLFVTDGVISLSCDIVFKAIGQRYQQPESESEEGNQLALDSRGRIAVDKEFRTNLSNVFAGGDCVDGEDLVVTAVDHGNKAALAIHQQI